jgi:hypothetical protein
MHNVDTVLQRNDRLNPAIGFLDIAQRFQRERLGLGWRDRLRTGLGGEREHDAHRLLGLVRMPGASSLGLAPALGRGS